MTDNPTQLENKLEPCPLSHYVHAGLRAYKTGPDPRIVCFDCGLTLRAPDWITVYERWNARAPVVAPQEDVLEVIRQYLRDHALSPRAPLLVDDEAVCVCVICQLAREVMQPVFAKDRAELDRVLVEAIRDDPVGVRLTELQLERETREGSFSAPSPSSPVPLEQERDFGPRSRVDDWPIVDVLGHLASATEHLLQHHNCDEHGHETWKYAAEAAWKHVALLNKPAATPTPVERLRSAPEGEMPELVKCEVADCNEPQRCFHYCQEHHRTICLATPSHSLAAREAANRAATEICDWCGIDSNDSERVAEIILKCCSPVPAAGGDEDRQELQKLRQAIGWICDACDAAYIEDPNNERIHELFNIAAKAAGLTRRLPDEHGRFDETMID